MSVNVTVNGSSYTIPQTSETGWGDNVTAWIQAISASTLQKTGGLFPLSAELDLGTNFGVKAAYLKSESANLSATGIVRLSNSDLIAWRNVGNTADLALKPGSADGILAYNAIDLPTISSTHTFTNKSIDATTNTLSNISNSSISASAGIAYSKLTLTGSIVNADISASAAIVGTKISGNISGNAANITGIAALANGGTGVNAASASAAFDALAPSTTKGDIIVRSSTSNTRLPIGTDGQVPVADSTQANGLSWKTLQQGAKNYITYNSFENNSTTGWSLAHSALTSSAPSSTTTAGTAFDSTHGGTAASVNLALSTTATGKLAGSYSASLASSAATTAGDLLISQAYTIDIEDQAKMLAFKFFYQLTAGTANFSGSSSNTWAVWIYDVTNGAWIQPQGVYNLVQSSGVGIASGTFQTPSNMTQFQIALVNLNATSGAVTVLLDDFTVGPQASIYGPSMDDWNTLRTVTPSSSAFGTVTASNIQTKRIGDTLRVRGSFKVGTAAGGTALFTLPVSIDFTKLNSTQSNIVGSFWTMDSGASASFSFGTSTAVTGALFADGTTANQVFLTQQAGANVFTKVAGSAFGSANYEVGFEFDVPVVGWSSNSVQSSDTDTRVCAATVQGPSGTLTNAFNDVTWGTIVDDSHGAFSGTTYTVPISGRIEPIGQLEITGTFAAGNTFQVQLMKNGSAIRTANVSAGGANGVLAAPLNFGEIVCNAGDTLKIQAFTTGTSCAYGTTAYNWLSFKRLSGPSVIAAAESVNLRYTTAAGQSLTSASETRINFGTKDFDSHSAVTTGASWVFTAPVSGKFRISAGIYMVLSTSTQAGIFLYKNAVYTVNLENKQTTWAGACSMAGTATLNLLAGDTIYVTGYQNSGGAVSLGATSTSNYIHIERVGN